MVTLVHLHEFIVMCISWFIGKVSICLVCNHPLLKWSQHIHKHLIWIHWCLFLYSIYFSSLFIFFFFQCKLYRIICFLRFFNSKVAESKDFIYLFIFHRRETQIHTMTFAILVDFVLLLRLLLSLFLKEIFLILI